MLLFIFFSNIFDLPFKLVSFLQYYSCRLAPNVFWNNMLNTYFPVTFLISLFLSSYFCLILNINLCCILIDDDLTQHWTWYMCFAMAFFLMQKLNNVSSCIQNHMLYSKNFPFSLFSFIYICSLNYPYALLNATIRSLLCFLFHQNYFHSFIFFLLFLFGSLYFLPLIQCGQVRCEDYVSVLAF